MGTKRYYVCEAPLIFQWGEWAYTPVVSLYPINGFSCVSDTPNIPWVLAIANSEDHTPIIADDRAVVLPDIPLDDDLSSIPNEDMSALLTRLAQLGVMPVDISAMNLYRDMLRAIGSQVQVGFNENNLKVR